MIIRARLDWADIVGHWALRGYGNFACIEKASGAFLGRCGPWFPEGWPALEIGYSFRRESWGRGFASEAASACARYAYEVLKAPAVISLVHPDNLRSQRVAERGGAKVEREMVLRGLPARVFSGRNTDPFPLSHQRNSARVRALAPCGRSYFSPP